MAVNIRQTEATDLGKAVENSELKVQELRTKAGEAEQKNEELKLKLEQARAEAERIERAEEEGKGTERELGEVAGG